MKILNVLIFQSKNVITFERDQSKNYPICNQYFNSLYIFFLIVIEVSEVSANADPHIKNLRVRVTRIWGLLQTSVKSECNGKGLDLRELPCWSWHPTHQVSMIKYGYNGQYIAEEIDTIYKFKIIILIPISLEINKLPINIIILQFDIYVMNVKIISRVDKKKVHVNILMSCIRFCG